MGTATHHPGSLVQSESGDEPRGRPGHGRAQCNSGGHGHDCRVEQIELIGPEARPFLAHTSLSQGRRPFPAGPISTYRSYGSEYGLTTLWLLKMPSTPPVPWYRVARPALRPQTRRFWSFWVDRSPRRTALLH